MIIFILLLYNHINFFFFFLFLKKKKKKKLIIFEYNSDDQKILQWSGEGEYINEAPNGIFDLSDQTSKSINSSLNKLSSISKQKSNTNLKKKVYFTSIEWFPIKGKAGTEIYAISSTDGIAFIIFIIIIKIIIIILFYFLFLNIME